MKHAQCIQSSALKVSIDKFHFLSSAFQYEFKFVRKLKFEMADLYFSMQLVDPSEEEYTLDCINERPTLKLSFSLKLHNKKNKDI